MARLRFSASRHSGVLTQPETLPAVLRLDHTGSLKNFESSQMQVVRGTRVAHVFCFYAPEVIFCVL